MLQSLRRASRTPVFRVFGVVHGVSRPSLSVEWYQSGRFRRDWWGGSVEGRRLSTNAPESSSMFPDIIVSSRATKRLKELNEEGEEEVRLRVAVEAGGCSGFQYTFDLITDPPKDDDLVVGEEGAQVVVDEVTLDLIRHSTIDFSTEMIRAGFEVVNNPLAEGGCGCGVSFALKEE